MKYNSSHVLYTMVNLLKLNTYTNGGTLVFKNHLINDYEKKKQHVLSHKFTSDSLTVLVVYTASSV